IFVADRSAGERGAGGLCGGQRFPGCVCGISERIGERGEAARADAIDQLAAVGGRWNESGCGDGAWDAAAGGADGGGGGGGDGGGDGGVVPELGIRSRAGAGGGRRDTTPEAKTTVC